MIAQIRGAALAVAAAGMMAGCGGLEAEDQLVSLKIHGDFDFRMGEPDDPEPFTIDMETSVDRDGHGTETTNGETHEFELSPGQLGELEDALAGVDFDSLEKDLGAREGETNTLSITYEGRTVVLDGGLESDEGETPKSATGVFTAIGILGEAAQTPEEEQAEVRRQQEHEEFENCIASRSSSKSRANCIREFDVDSLSP